MLYASNSTQIIKVQYAPGRFIKMTIDKFKELKGSGSLGLLMAQLRRGIKVELL